MTLAVVVTLAVDAAAQASFSENLLVDLALLAQLHLLLEDIDLAAKVGRNSLAQLFIPSDLVLHNKDLSSNAADGRFTFLIVLVRNRGKFF